MLLLNRVTSDLITAGASYIEEVKTYCIEFSSMDDNSKPMELGASGCLWLTENGLISEIEVTFPITVNEKPYRVEITQRGTPHFTYTESGKTIDPTVFVSNGRVTVFWGPRQSVCKAYSFPGCRCLIWGEELVGVEADLHERGQTV